MSDKIKIYWLSDSPTTSTGFATISTQIMNRLSERGYEVHYQAHNYLGETIRPGLTFKDGRKLNFWVYGTGTQPYARDVLTPRIRELKPDIFGILLDTFMLAQGNVGVPPYWFMNMDFAPAKTCFYFPSDGGGGLPLGCDGILRKCHVSVAMAKFGQRQAKELHGLNTQYIPHAIDPSHYYKLKDKEREELKKKWGLEGKFVIGCVARHQGRKMLDRAIKAFNKIKDKIPEAILFFHCDPHDAAGHFNMIELIKRYNLQNRIAFSGIKFFLGFDYSAMNNVYNLMDVFFLPTSGEGFGVPIIEAMSCELPCVVTDYTTTPELLIEEGKCGLPVKLSGVSNANFGELMLEKGVPQNEIDRLLDAGTITGSWNVERGVMDTDHAAECLLKLYKDENLRKELGKMGREKVLKFYDWNKVINDWDNLFQGMVER